MNENEPRQESAPASHGHSLIIFWLATVSILLAANITYSVWRDQYLDSFVSFHDSSINELDNFRSVSLEEFGELQSKIKVLDASLSSLGDKCDLIVHDAKERFTQISGDVDSLGSKCDSLNDKVISTMTSVMSCNANVLQRLDRHNQRINNLERVNGIISPAIN